MPTFSTTGLWLWRAYKAESALVTASHMASLRHDPEALFGVSWFYNLYIYTEGI